MKKKNDRFTFISRTANGQEFKILGAPSENTCSAIGATSQRLSNELVQVLSVSYQGALTPEYIKQYCPEIVNCVTDAELEQLILKISQSGQAFNLSQWIRDTLKKRLGHNVSDETIARYQRRGKPKA